MKSALAGLLTFFTFSLFAQSEAVGPAVAADSLSGNQKPSPWHLSFQAGASVGSFGGHAFSSSFVAPAVSYSLNDNLSLFGGISYMKGFLPMAVPVTDFNDPITFGAVNGVGTFAGLAYQLNPRLVMYGAIHGRSFTSPLSPGNDFGKIEPGYTVGFEYKSSENFSFGVEISRTSGYNPLSGPGLFPHTSRMQPMGW